MSKRQPGNTRAAKQRPRKQHRNRPRNPALPRASYSAGPAECAERLNKDKDDDGGGGGDDGEDDDDDDGYCRRRRLI